MLSTNNCEHCNPDTPDWSGEIWPGHPGLYNRDVEEDKVMNAMKCDYEKSLRNAGGLNIREIKEKLDEAKECLNLPDNEDKADCEWKICYPEPEDPEEVEDELTWLRENEGGVRMTVWRGKEDQYGIDFDGVHLDNGQKLDMFCDTIEKENYLLNLKVSSNMRKEFRKRRKEYLENYYNECIENGTCFSSDYDGHGWKYWYTCQSHFVGWGNVESNCSFEKIDSCFCGCDKNHYKCIYTPCCHHKMHLRCLYSWYSKKDRWDETGEERTTEHCPYCRADWDDGSNGLHPP